ncbi:MAG: enoyl-CoA hydratase/isomerase family protein [Pseudomonadales bacterium]
MTAAVVLFEERQAGSKKIAIATLNVEKTLNSLSLAMVELLTPQLQAWADDDAVACVFLQGAGDKAFCAGGDVVALHNGSAAYGEELPSSYCTEFFEQEYRLDYLIHTYAKPLIVWANGIVMGGGLGLMSGASHRVVTESTRMAMPEITIGLYPDVGGTWFLNRAPGRSGLFLGLTGANINASDAIFIGYADRLIKHDQKSALLDALVDTDWAADSAGNLVDHLLARFEASFDGDKPADNVAQHMDWINTVTQGDDLLGIIEAITSYSGDDSWCQRAARTLASGCPVTPFLVWEQLARGKDMTLADVFRMELTMSSNCARLGHFKEGVRALLVDKDRSPQFVPASFAEVTPAMVEAHFEMSDVNPLSDL